MNRLTACLTLRLLPGIGPITAQKLVHTYGSPEAIFDAEPHPEKVPNERLRKLLEKARSVQKEVASIKEWMKKEALMLRTLMLKHQHPAIHSTLLNRFS